MKTIEKSCKRCGKAFQAPLWRETTKAKLGPQKFCGKDCASRGGRFVPFEERFWAKVNKTEGCWLWTGTTTPFGYGQIWYTLPNGRQTMARAHKLSYQMLVGPVPKGLGVLHRCDVPTCVNPAHLFLGTAKENMEDCSRKGRKPKGEKKVVSPEKRQRMEQMIREGYTHREIQKELGVCQRTVERCSSIVKGYSNG